LEREPREARKRKLFFGTLFFAVFAPFAFDGCRQYRLYS
jgi:hypothetical protein